MSFFKKNKLLFLVFLLALFLRLYKLGTIPVGFHADEVRAGWNAYSILKTGHDDRGNLLPLYYNTFGDFRPTGIIYLIIPSLFVLGRSVFSVRFLPALIGAFSILPVYFLSLEISKKRTIATWSAFFLSISPWHISVSRATSEVCVSMFFALWGMYFLLKSKPNYLSSVFLIFISYLFYHSIRLLAPMFIFVIVLKKLGDRKAWMVFIAIVLMTGIFSLKSQSRARFNQVSIFSDLDAQKELSRMPFEEGQNNVLVARIFHNKLLTYGRWFINEYSSYFSANFLLTDVGKPGRYMTPGIGVLLYSEIIFLICGLVAISQKRSSVLPLLLLLIAPIAAALTTEDSPNMHRAFYMVPFIVMIEAEGMIYLPRLLRKIFFLGIFFNLIFYLHMYYVHSKYKIASDRSYGSVQVANKLLDLKDSYDKIMLTNIPDDLYPWIAFLGKFDAAEFNKSAVLREKGVWEYQNFIFSTQRCPSRDAFDDTNIKSLLVVDAEGCATESKLNDRSDVKKEEIKRPDESVVYTIWSRE